jgi:hypothetical protein
MVGSGIVNPIVFNSSMLAGVGEIPNSSKPQIISPAVKWTYVHLFTGSM